MPHFHFHQQDGKQHPDEDGVDLPDMDAARTTALRALTEMVRNHEREFWATGQWRMTVTDETGLALFCLDLSTTEAPAAQGAGAAKARGGMGR
jgi:hypothetical protein